MIRRSPASVVAISAAIAVSVGACGGSEAASPPPVNDVSAQQCIVRLHGKGGDGTDSVLDDGVAIIAPRGNAEGWGGWQWIYFPPAEYDEARDVVASAVDEAGCESVVVNGFSNGAAFTAAMYCRGESFDGRLIGVVIDDPVTDAVTQECSPTAGVDAVVYWTGALEFEAPAGTECDSIDWTCDGDVVFGIDEYAALAGIEVTASPFTSHEWYLDAPEPFEWLADAPT
jgi:pimeloyl-ACP methyl ester carboxylesterase